MRISVIGIGAMGGPIALNLLKAGHSVIVYNRTPDRTDALRAAGAVAATSIAEACKAGVVVTMLSDDAAMDAVVFKSGQFLPSFEPSCVHVSMSTISAEMARRLTAAHAAGGGRFLSAPVFGRPDAAQAAALFVIAAGPADTIEGVAEVFAAIAKRVIVAGEIPFHANIVKLCGNFLLLSAVESLAEVFRLADQQGLARDALLDILTGTLFTAPLYRGYGSLMVERRFSPAGFKLRLGLKDIELLLEAARTSQLLMPAANIIRDQLRQAAGLGLSEQDVASLALLDR